MAHPVNAESNARWFAIDVDVELTAREAVEYALMEAGALGTETNDSDSEILHVVGYFSGVPDREAIRLELFEALRIYELPSSAARTMTVREVDNRDWLAEWKKGWEPVAVGRFIVAPPWSEIDERPGRLVIRIEPGMAFGTGTHETTRLCLTAIEKYFAGGTFLDIGTGTGILAIAAAKLSPDADIEACDTDAEAIAIALENAEANKVAGNISFRVGSLDDYSVSADLVCANLTADVILNILPALISVTCGRLVLSGILDTQLDAVRTRLLELGIDECEVAQDGEWVSVVV